MPPRPLWPGFTPALAETSADLQTAFGPDLLEYIAQRSGERVRAPKVINDPVWRTVRIEPWEVPLLDSPTIQRLRRIHQLGLASYVYLGASYSRFVHSVGVLHQTQRLIDAVNRNARSKAAQINVPTDQPVSKGDEILLRLSALFHDAGHGFMSHVSERALSALPALGTSASVRILRSEAQEFFACPNPPAAAEVLSSLIVLLPEFIELLKVADIPLWKDHPTDLALKMAKLIAGSRSSDRPFLAEIISGALDADKLDYMPRDCYMAGLAMPIDVDRLLDKIQVVRISARRLLDSYRVYSQLPPDRIVEVLAVQAGGARAFEEMVLTRLLLYDKLYYHQKVRAMEGMVVNALELLIKTHAEFQKPSTYLKMTDEQFLLGSWPATTSNAPEITWAQQLVSDVVRRRTFIRCFAFGPPFITHPDPDDEQAIIKSWGALEPCISARRSPEFVKFREDVTQRAREYLDAVGQPKLAENLRDHHIVVDLPDVQGIAEKTRIFVGDEQFGIEVYTKRFRVERWAEAYESQKTTGLVYAPAEFARAVHFAVRDLIRERFDLGFEDWSWNRTKLSPEDLKTFGDLLTERRGSPVFTLPQGFSDSQTYLESKTGKARWLDLYEKVLSDLADRFKTFKSATDDTVGVGQIKEWLLQFEYEDIPVAIKALQHIQYWDRSAAANAFAFGIEQQFPLPIDIQCLPLGGPTTSSRHLMYLWPEVTTYLPRHRVKVLDSPQELRPKTPLLLYDDNVGSGGQGCTVLAQWYERPDLGGHLKTGQ